MNAVSFDTLKLARSLREKAKLSPEQAEGFADAFNEAMQGDIATKADIAALGRDMSALGQDVQARIRELELKIKEAELRLASQAKDVELRLGTQIGATKSELLKWLVGSVGLQTIVILGAVTVVVRTLHA